MIQHERSLELPLPPQGEGVASFHWLRDSLRNEILRGGLEPGRRLPSTRQMAVSYKLSRGTVLTAIDDLRAEGYVYGRRGSGTFVSDVPPERFLRGQTIVPHTTPRRGPSYRSEFAGRLTPTTHYFDKSSLAFRTNLPALDLFPTTLWAQVASRRLRQLTTQQLLGCSAQGYDPLRHAVAGYLRSSRGVVCDESQILIVSGVQEALDLTARILINPGDRVLIEDPGYQFAYGAFGAAGATLIPVPVDGKGAAPKRKDFAGARILYLTPGHQFPTCVTMPFARRIDILHHAREAGTYIFEDDYDSEYRFAGSPLPAMQGLDEEGLVLYAGSLNKVLFPSFRMGYVVLPPDLVEAFAAVKGLVSRHHSVVDQAVMCDFIELGHFGRHLRRTRKIYAERLAALSYHAREHLADFLDLSKIEAGLQTVGWLKPGINADRAAECAAKRRIDVVPISRYHHSEEAREGLQIGFAAVDERAIEQGVKELAIALRAAST